MAMFGRALPEGILLTRICGGGVYHIRYGYEGSIFFSVTDLYSGRNISEKFRLE